MLDTPVNNTLIYIGSIMLVIWGIAHIIPTRNIIKGFGEISRDNKLVLAMEVIAEGLTLIFLGVVPLLMVWNKLTISKNAITVYQAEAVFLLALAALTIFTGARTKVIWYKICPFVLFVVAILYYLASTISPK